MDVASTGSTPTSRNRPKEENFLGLEVDVPPIEDQFRLERLLLIADEARRLRSRPTSLGALAIRLRPPRRLSVLEDGEDQTGVRDGTRKYPPPHVRSRLFEDRCPHACGRA